jgi:hypothetical protein
MFDAWVKAFESTIELFIGGELGKGLFISMREEWDESVEFRTIV